ncbi:MAG TPA: DUF2637 domain-containing protein [Vulgatibacteraceae bacterium]|nr:DUF2637 domain-containing protein [Vulgatibacteraceae bacterium]
MSDRFIRAAAALVVIVLGAIAAVISYRHAYTLAVDHGETGTTAALVPVTADGLLLVAGLVMLDAARRGVPAPPLARLALALGIVATIAANLAHGLDHGLVGALVAAWPAVTLILTVELLMGMIRRAQAAPVGVPDGTLAAELDEPERWSGGPVGMEWWETLPAVESAPEVVETARESAPEVVATAVTETGDLAPVIATARERFAETLATGALPSVRALRRELHIGHPRAVRVRAALEAETARESTLATAGERS